MGIFDLFKKKKEVKKEEPNICDLYLSGNASAEELLDEVVYLFILGCVNFFYETNQTVRYIEEHNDDEFERELVEDLVNGVKDSVSDDVKRTILGFYQADKDEYTDTLLKKRDLMMLGMNFLNISHYVGVGMLVKPDPVFDILKGNKLETLDSILARKQACERAFLHAKENTYPEKDGSYIYPEFPTLQQLSLYYDLMRGLYDLLNVDLGQYTKELNDGDQAFLDVYTDIYTMTWNPILAPMINPENGQLSLPDENGIWKPIEPDYIGMMKEIDFKGVI